MSVRAGRGSSPLRRILAWPFGRDRGRFRGVRSTRGARTVLTLVADRGSFREWDPVGTEAVLTGEARLDGHPLALIISNFDFMAGTMGLAAGDRVTRAFELACERRLPVLAVCASGGVRMQEGVGAFMHMVKAADAVRRHRAAGLLYVAYLGQPTTGGVYASWGSLASLTYAAPGALIGFTGPKVVEMLTGHEELRGVQVAENLLRHGLLDDIFPVVELRRRMGRLLRSLQPIPSASALAPVPAPSSPSSGDAWQAVVRSRDQRRPGSRDLVRAALDEATFLRGDRSGLRDDAACLAAIGRFRGRPVMVIGNDRAGGLEPARISVVGLRKARRAMALAAELRLPVTTLIDTSGAEVSAEAEEAGLAPEIAQCIADLVGLPVPTVAVLLGQGTGGGALAFLPADRVIAAENGWLSPISPEGASAIVHGSIRQAPEMAESQGIVSWRLHAAGIVDNVVAEPGGDGATDPDAFVEAIAAGVAAALADLESLEWAERLQRRRMRYRDL